MKDDHYFRQLDRDFERNLEANDKARETIARYRKNMEKAARWRRVLDQAGVKNTAELIEKELATRVLDWNDPAFEDGNSWPKPGKGHADD